jgi:predicted ATPase
MITKLHIESWKSFADSTLHIDPLTVLIGLNASGKSNALDAFSFLNRVSNGIPLVTALQGDGTQSGVRGGGGMGLLQQARPFRAFGCDWRSRRKDGVSLSD